MHILQILQIYIINNQLPKWNQFNLLNKNPGSNSLSTYCVIKTEQYTQCN